jgi:hypothetical protein
MGICGHQRCRGQQWHEAGMADVIHIVVVSILLLLLLLLLLLCE